MEIPARLQKYIDWVKNAGDGATVDNFVDDFDPVGNTVLNDLRANLLVKIEGEKIILNPGLVSE